jgi:hypothetical protein
LDDCCRWMAIDSQVSESLGKDELTAIKSPDVRRRVSGASKRIPARRLGKATPDEKKPRQGEYDEAEGGGVRGYGLKKSAQSAIDISYPTR